MTHHHLSTKIAIKVSQVNCVSGGYKIPKFCIYYYMGFRCPSNHQFLISGVGKKYICR